MDNKYLLLSFSHSSQRSLKDYTKFFWAPTSKLCPCWSLRPVKGLWKHWWSADTSKGNMLDPKMLCSSSSGLKFEATTLIDHTFLSPGQAKASWEQYAWAEGEKEAPHLQIHRHYQHARHSCPFGKLKAEIDVHLTGRWWSSFSWFPRWTMIDLISRHKIQAGGRRPLKKMIANTLNWSPSVVTTWIPSCVDMLSS